MSSSPNYTNINDPFNNELIRDESYYNGVQPDQNQGGRTTQVGSTLNDVWLDTWIKSRNYQPKKQGFLIDAQKGYIECSGLWVGGGGIQGSSLDVPDPYTPGWHVDVVGNMWSGATVAQFEPLGPYQPLVIDTANAVIVDNGQAYFKDVHIKIIYTPGGPTLSSPGAEFNINAFNTPSDGGVGINRVKINQSGIVVRNKNISSGIGSAGLFFEGWGSIVGDERYAQIFVSDDTGSGGGLPDWLMVELSRTNIMCVQTDATDPVYLPNRLFTLNGVGGRAYIGRQLLLADDQRSPIIGPAYVPTTGTLKFATSSTNLMNGSIYFNSYLDFYSGPAATPTLAGMFTSSGFITNGFIALDYATIYGPLTASWVDVTGSSIRVGGTSFVAKILKYKDWTGANKSMTVLGV